MVVMVVADEGDVDAGQVVPADAGLAEAFWANPGERTGSFGPDGVGEDVEAGVLEQHGGVVDEGDSDFAVVIRG